MLGLCLRLYLPGIGVLGRVDHAIPFDANLNHRCFMHSWQVNPLTKNSDDGCSPDSSLRALCKGCARKRSVSDKAALNGIQCVAGGEFGCKRHIVGDARCITAGDPCQWCK